MNLLFKRGQTAVKVGRVHFTLWSKLELTEDEKALLQRYRFHEAVLIQAVQPTLIRNAILIGVLMFFVFGVPAVGYLGSDIGGACGVVAGAASGFWYFNEKRETIYVRDLLYGRDFKCKSVIELARKEAWLETISSYLRQVMESAKHWDGTARREIEPLPKDEARQVILKGV